MSSTTSSQPYTHEDLSRWLACSRRFWLQRHVEPSSEALLMQGAASGKGLDASPAAQDQALRATFPQAIVIDTPQSETDWLQAIARTHAVLAEGWLAGVREDEGRAILGACLESNEGVRVRVDVLAAGPYGLRLFKVRYATVGDERDVDMVALWTHVAARNGLRVQSAGLMLVDTDFVYPGLGCYAGLFREVELMPVLGSRSVPDWLVAMRACERDTEPAPPDEAPCHTPSPCAFVRHCGQLEAGHGRKDPADLDLVGRELAGELRELGHISVRTVSLDELPDERRRRAVRAVQQGRPIMEPEVADLIATMAYPRYALRIDTIGFALPSWPGTRPYQIMPFQWTCDVEQPDGRLSHHAFLATQQGDPRRAFALSLIEVLGTTGPIFAYNAGFERNRLRELATAFDDLASALEALQPRIVDLFQVARAHYYHPDMCGSWSFKSIVHALAPETRADQFDWQGITEAQEAFALSLQGVLGQAQLDSLRQALLAYGQRQTTALRGFVRRFSEARTKP
ncbi:MAG: DUF2779 domain-containing protein [Aquabacterium sp.]|uniref:DUF2779 domain-containing protein n=1 Tax=Aquabacterium sp. TaxID=1872578 RepID=UPI0025BA42C6|nr:DUF2779 domain-containing protein [Aquabacterium sp.]MBI5927339.1 DUF2779 domain-containing protein [Aquabacterium sp.]